MAHLFRGQLSYQLLKRNERLCQQRIVYSSGRGGRDRRGNCTVSTDCLQQRART